MACTSTNYPAVAPLFTTAATVPSSAVFGAGPYLVVSNEPEPLAFPNIQLYKCEIPIGDSDSQRIRVFIWHQAIDANRTFHIAARLGSGTGTVSGFVGHVEEVTDAGSIAAGICCAQAVLYNMYDSSFASVNLTSAETVIYTKSIDSGKLLGRFLNSMCPLAILQSCSYERM